MIVLLTSYIIRRDWEKSVVESIKNQGTSDQELKFDAIYDKIRNRVSFKGIYNL